MNDRATPGDSVAELVSRVNAAVEAFRASRHRAVTEQLFKGSAHDVDARPEGSTDQDTAISRDVAELVRRANRADAEARQAIVQLARNEVAPAVEELGQRARHDSKVLELLAELAGFGGSAALAELVRLTTTGNVLAQQRLYDLAATGSAAAQSELLRVCEPIIKPAANRIVARLSAGQIVRATEVMDDAFLRLFGYHSEKASAAAGPPAFGKFIAYMCRAMGRVLVDLLREQKGADTTTVRNLLLERLSEDGTIRSRLDATHGKPDLVCQVFSDLLWDPVITRRCQQANVDPSQVLESLRRLIRKPEVQAVLEAPNSATPGAYDRILTFLRSDLVRMELMIYHRPQADRSEPEAVQPAVSRHSVMTIEEALQKLDDDFAEGPKRDPARRLADDAATERLANQLEPRRSVHAQILDLLFYGGCTWAEVARLLELTPDRLRRKYNLAADRLRQLLIAALGPAAPNLDEFAPGSQS